jgi:hypothetical protein
MSSTSNIQYIRTRFFFNDSNMPFTLNPIKTKYNKSRKRYIKSSSNCPLLIIWNKITDNLRCYTAPVLNIWQHNLDLQMSCWRLGMCINFRFLVCNTPHRRTVTKKTQRTFAFSWKKQTLCNFKIILISAWFFFHMERTKGRQRSKRDATHS